MGIIRVPPNKMREGPATALLAPLPFPQLGPVRKSSGHKKARLHLSMKPGIYLATTYSHRTYRPTTIGAAAFHFRVRNGTGWFRLAVVTRGQSWGRRASARKLQNWVSGDFA